MQTRPAGQTAIPAENDNEETIPQTIASTKAHRLCATRVRQYSAPTSERTCSVIVSCQPDRRLSLCRSVKISQAEGVNSASETVERPKVWRCSARTIAATDSRNR